MKTAGMDADSFRLAGGVVLPTGKLEEVYELPRADSRGRVLPEYPGMLLALVRRFKAQGVVLYLEDIFLASGAKENVVTFKALAHVRGEVHLAAAWVGLPIVDVPAVTWHASVLAGVKGRDALKDWALRRAEIAVKEARLDGVELNSHKADGICIALHGWGATRGGLVPAPEQAKLKFRRAR